MLNDNIVPDSTASSEINLGPVMKRKFVAFWNFDAIQLFKWAYSWFEQSCSCTWLWVCKLFLHCVQSTFMTLVVISTWDNFDQIFSIKISIRFFEKLWQNLPQITLKKPCSYFWNIHYIKGISYESGISSRLIGR